MVVDLRSITQVHAFYLGQYDDFSLKSFLNLIAPNSMVVDVGGNIGFYAIAIASRLRKLNGQGRVFVFEPCDSNVARLLDNVEINGVRDWVDIFPLGLSDRRRTAQLVLREEFQCGSETGNASIEISEEWDAGLRRAHVQLDTLDLLALEGTIKKCDLIKVDIEGHEDCFLAGGTDTLRRDRPIILMEVNKPYYQARGIRDLEMLFSRVIPHSYLKFRPEGGRWTEAASIDECKEYENIYLVPDEKRSYWEARVQNTRSVARLG